jgi:hypothetical protein
MRCDTKIAIVVRDDLAAWQRPNVTAFLAMSGHDPSVRLACRPAAATRAHLPPAVDLPSGRS